KEKIKIDYMLNSVSGNIVWNSISTPSGMENWFADEVKVNDKIYTFRWGNDEIRQATVTGIRNGSFIRFKWLDEAESNPKAYFELKMSYNELTKDYVLEIVDFAEPDERQEQIELWDMQINTLKRVCGL
ncbi:MAG: hypothetical protein IKP63_05135, partial [Paludibacteraceae bacterium]|nr:hypothetical protein [Paludibacteraceae bacterium]